MEAQTVFSQLYTALAKHRSQLAHLRSLPETQLRTAPKPGKWSVTECIEHLNLTYVHYLPKIQAALQTPQSSGTSAYRQGIFGGMMINSMQPKGEKRGIPMKTFAKFIPQTAGKTTSAIFDAYTDHLDQIEACIKQSEGLDLNGNRIVSAIGPVLKFKLGDCYRFLMAHDDRHLLQAEKLLR